jgi:hypothetical protein
MEELIGFVEKCQRIAVDGTTGKLKINLYLTVLELQKSRKEPIPNG